MRTFYKTLNEIKKEVEKYLKTIESIAGIKEVGCNMQLKEVVALKYKKQILEKLRTALAESSSNAVVNTDELIQKLTEILAENWSVVKDNMCCYTALPEDDVTILLCDIALLLAEQANESSSQKSARVFIKLCQHLIISAPNLVVHRKIFVAGKLLAPNYA